MDDGVAHETIIVKDGGAEETDFNSSYPSLSGVAGKETQISAYLSGIQNATNQFTFTGNNLNTNATVNISSSVSGQQPSSQSQSVVLASDHGSITITGQVALGATTVGVSGIDVNLSTRSSDATLLSGIQLQISADQGKVFNVCTDETLIVTANTNNPFLLVVNPATSTKIFKMLDRNYNVFTKDAEVKFRLQLDPTVTTSGTSLNITNLKQNGTSVGYAYVGPTVTSSGTLLDLRYVNDNALQDHHDNGWIQLTPGHSWLIMANPEAGNRLISADMKWAEL
ncbi:hypothetical protein HY496_02475 [Candidatus Woesearchaeota archaeon]|nr:hypothetical protein [Candidatus Woesearchaeota archaeon]